MDTTAIERSSRVVFDNGGQPMPGRVERLYERRSRFGRTDMARVALDAGYRAAIPVYRLTLESEYETEPEVCTAVDSLDGLPF